ncbi:unnamed protein product [Hydatigera taeniaeformis]|uniref:Uncharacterized protein n=1 Tax=Hydatigena taeniaeformis TaxID=6205 RepID=A0A0R3XD22_HYDTA|nr:unnamed protein product [Hydatigera taeniaeformis]VDM36463.1 unnamed protein product [Hydatigera taeniaeformis]
MRLEWMLLDIPKFVPPCPSQYLPKNGVATKRRVTGDCGFGGSLVHGRNRVSASVDGVTGGDGKAVRCHQPNEEEGSNVGVRAPLGESTTPS